MDQIKALSKLDRVGTLLSLVCALHCIALPFIMTLLPLIGLKFLQDSGVDMVLIVVAVTVALTSLCWGAQIHGRYNLLGLVLIALAIFSIAHLFEGQYLHASLMAVGGLTLATAHILNHRLCKNCSGCCSHSVR